MALGSLSFVTLHSGKKLGSQTRAAGSCQNTDQNLGMIQPKQRYDVVVIGGGDTELVSVPSHPTMSGAPLIAIGGYSPP